MKKKDFKRAESLFFLALEVFGKAVELKSLQVEERKLKFEENKWLNERSGNEIMSKISSGGMKADRIWMDELKMKRSKEVDVKDNFVSFCEDQSNTEGRFSIESKYDSGGLIDASGEKFLKNAFDLIEKVKSVSEPLKSNVDEFQQRNFKFINPKDSYFHVDRGRCMLYLCDKEKELFCFDDREKNKVIILKTPDEIEKAISLNLEIYFRWVRQ
jgi:hypothetical protein